MVYHSGWEVSSPFGVNIDWFYINSRPDWYEHNNHRIVVPMTGYKIYINTKIETR